MALPIASNCIPSLLPGGNSLYSERTASSISRPEIPVTMASSNAKYLLFHTTNNVTTRMQASIRKFTLDASISSASKQAAAVTDNIIRQVSL